MNSDETQVKQAPVTPKPFSKATPSAARYASDSSTPVRGSQGNGSPPQTTSKFTEQQVDQSELVAATRHTSAIARDGSSGSDSEQATPSPHARVPVCSKSDPSSNVIPASTQFVLLPAGKHEQHKVEESEDAKRERIAAYAANRQGAQLEAADSLPSALLPLSPGTPPIGEVVTLSTKHASEASLPENTDTNVSTRYSHYPVSQSEDTTMHVAVCCSCLCPSKSTTVASHSLCLPCL